MLFYFALSTENFKQLGFKMQIDEKTLIAVAAILNKISANITNALDNDDIEQASLLNLSEIANPIVNMVFSS